ncbi:dihydroorotase [Candidatus Ichthyocystis sparus]|uniref:dihydroorotase n=1 Tax=Candidatus Ichthyocystis sparus TaxID=1561004 RepID=UPI001F5E76CA|nr:dihydroorotase [Candidatus Ichthyocystis sparus]
MMKTITIKAPDDWHLHLRDGDIARAVIGDTCRQFRRALIMPNLEKPITTVSDAILYQNRIKNLQPHPNFTLFMTLYLTDKLSVKDVYEVGKNDDVLAIKWYPKGVTTNSCNGIAHSSLIKDDVLDAIVKNNIVLCVHGESSLPGLDPFDREKIFLEDELKPLQKRFPKIKVVLEHITTRQAVEYVMQTPNTAATITAHHLAFDRRDLLDRRIRPHLYCLPIMKRWDDRKALIEAAISGSPKFFLGTDSAPHTSDNKESSCGCAGCYTAAHAIELYASIFDTHGNMDKLEYFSSIAGANFYGHNTNKESLIIEPEEWTVPEAITLSNMKKIVPLCAGKTFLWKARMVLI